MRMSAIQSTLRRLQPLFPTCTCVMRRWFLSSSTCNRPRSFLDITARLVVPPSPHSPIEPELSAWLPQELLRWLRTARYGLRWLNMALTVLRTPVKICRKIYPSLYAVQYPSLIRHVIRDGIGVRLSSLEWREFRRTNCAGATRCLSVRIPP